MTAAAAGSGGWSDFHIWRTKRMLSRALSLATVMLLIGCFAAAPAHAQNLEAGKSPSQIFAGACTACHKSPRGLLKTIAPGSLPGFLREHYTTSSGMASLLSSYLISNGAADTRYGGGQPRPDKGAKSEARSGGEPEQVDRHGRRISPSREAAEPPQAARPDADRLSSQAEPRQRSRNARRLERPGEGPDAAKPAEAQGGTAQQANQRGRGGRKARHRPGKRGSPVIDEEPGMGAAAPEAGKSDAAKSEDATSQPGKTDAAKTDAAKDQSAKTEPAKQEKPAGGSASDESGKPAAEASGGGSSAAAKVEPPEETGSSATPVQRADPVPAVTPAPTVPSAASTAAPSATSAAASSA
ncbi:MAG TPA: hypothetical protein VIM02_05380, partial [Rhizomicrobium sp.]